MKLLRRISSLLPFPFQQRLPRNFPWKLYFRLVTAQSGLILLALFISGIGARTLFKSRSLEQTTGQLQVALLTLSHELVPSSGADWCSRHRGASSLRLTVIDPQGVVRCDTHHDPQTMENHVGRPEIIAAVAKGFGHSVRNSPTLSEEMLYGAIMVQGLVLRGAVPLSELSRTLRTFDLYLLAFLLLAGLLLVSFAAWTGMRLAVPIGFLIEKSRGLLDPARVPDSEPMPYGELSDLEVSLDEAKRTLQTRAESLRRERDEQATVMAAISDAILAVDLDGAALFFNSRFELHFAQPKGQSTAHSHLWEIFREPEILDTFKVAISKGRPVDLTATRVGASADGSPLYFSLSVSPLRRSGSPQIYGAVGVFHDVTELKRAEQMRIDFVANVSHELRTPLTSIQGFTETLLEDVRAGRPLEERSIVIVRRNALRLASLVQDLLDLSSLESGAEELAKEELRAGEVTDRAEQQLQGRLSAKRITLQVEGREARVWADPRRLEQVLVNLLDNAVKYTPPDGAVTVSWRESPAEGSTWLTVNDTGPGIPEEHRSRLFERFYRVDKARSRELGGTGLGLAIVKHILQRHGGGVSVADAPGGGASFVCRIPTPGS